MKKLRLPTRICCCLCGLLFPFLAQAMQPIVTILGLAVADTGLSKADGRTPPSWRDKLSATERQALDRLRNQEAVAACIAAADGQSPVAAYHLRKIAQFAVVAAGHRSADLEELDYQRPAMAMRWCTARARNEPAAGPLERYAEALWRVALMPPGRQLAAAP